MATATRMDLITMMMTTSKGERRATEPWFVFPTRLKPYRVALYPDHADELDEEPFTRSDDRPQSGSADAGRSMGDLAGLDELDLALSGHGRIRSQADRLDSRISAPSGVIGSRSQVGLRPETNSTQTQNSFGAEGGTSARVDIDETVLRDFVTKIHSKKSAKARKAPLFDDDDDEQRRLFERELATTRGWKRSKGIRNRRDYSTEVTQLLQEAHSAYAGGEFELAIEKYSEVIRIDPTAHEAWQVLGLTHEEMGNEELGLRAKVTGAMLVSTPADQWVSFGSASYRFNLLRQAEFCFRQARKSDAKNTDAMHNRAHCLYQLQDYSGACSEYATYLENRPMDGDAAHAYALACVNAGDRVKAVRYLETVMEWSMRTFPDPDKGPVEKIPANYPEKPPLTEDHIATLADLYIRFGQPAKSVEVIRKCARWMQGRHKETFWDAVEDDREFDEEKPQPNTEHRKRVYSRRIQSANPNRLTVLLRFHLAQARLKMHHVEEARVSSNALDCQHRLVLNKNVSRFTSE